MVSAAKTYEKELAKRLKIDRKTVLNYIDILEKSYVIKRLYPFSHNPRCEIGKKSKIYFIDLGIRNALIGDFNDLSLRPDRGAVWENFLIIERTKTYLIENRTAYGRFWHNYGGAEVDYIEETGGNKIQAFEIKFGSSALSRGSELFKRTYGWTCNWSIKTITSTLFCPIEMDMNLHFKETCPEKLSTSI